MWAVCEYHIQRLGIIGNPLDNVVDWSRFMGALEVQAWVDSSVEPRQMVPYQLAILAAGVNNRTHPTSGNTLAFCDNDKTGF